jgi:hypothetical protein
LVYESCCDPNNLLDDPREYPLKNIKWQKFYIRIRDFVGIRYEVSSHEVTLRDRMFYYQKVELQKSRLEVFVFSMTSFSNVALKPCQGKPSQTILLLTL